MKKFFVAALVLSAVAGFAQAATVTNSIGQVMTVSKLSEAMAASTVVTDQSRLAHAVGEIGVLVANCKITSSTAVGAHDISLATLPKGAILMEDAFIEVTTALEPATSTNSLEVGGITVLATGVTLQSTGIKAAVATIGMTTAADKLSLTLSGDAATNGNFTVYIPYLLGTAQ